jgi:hypothetical protein
MRFYRLNAESGRDTLPLPALMLVGRRASPPVAGAKNGRKTLRTTGVKVPIAHLDKVGEFPYEL